MRISLDNVSKRFELSLHRRDSFGNPPNPGGCKVSRAPPFGGRRAARKLADECFDRRIECVEDVWLQPGTRGIKLSELVSEVGQALLGRAVFSDASNGLFLAAPRRTGKSTFLQADLQPALEAIGVVVYVG